MKLLRTQLLKYPSKNIKGNLLYKAYATNKLKTARIYKLRCPDCKKMLAYSVFYMHA
jgi:hypothetical protein